MEQTFRESWASGPRERLIGADCETCHIVEGAIECTNCHDALCEGCAIVCAECGGEPGLLGSEPLCVRCALRSEFEKRGDSWYCGNCPLPEVM